MSDESQSIDKYIEQVLFNRLGKSESEIDRIKRNLIEIEKSIGETSNSEAITKKVSDVRKDVEYLKENVEKSKMYYDKTVSEINQQVKYTNNRIDNMQRWLIGGLSGLALNLLLQIIQMNGQ